MSSRDFGALAMTAAKECNVSLGEDADLSCEDLRQLGRLLTGADLKSSHVKLTVASGGFVVFAG